MTGSNLKNKRSRRAPGRPRKGLTAGVIAEAIARTGDPDEVRRLLRSVRYWTSEGLLSLTVEKHPGGGYHRIYTGFAVYEAALIYELGRYGLTAEDLVYPMFALEQLRTDTAKGKGFERWGQAVYGAREVWFLLARPYGDTKKLFVDIGDRWTVTPEGAFSMIEVHLTRLFERVHFEWVHE